MAGFVHIWPKIVLKQPSIFRVYTWLKQALDENYSRWDWPNSSKIKLTYLDKTEISWEKLNSTKLDKKYEVLSYLVSFS